jgi:prephenate dehydrogenase
VSSATRVAIIGLGAIGGSAALKLRQRGAVPTGFTVDEEDRRLARAAGVDVRDSIAEAVRDADLVLIAVPLDKLSAVASDVCAAAPSTATILHAASLQRPDATRLPPAIGDRVTGTHPIAGTDRSGFAAASAEMFRGARVFIDRRDDKQVREDAELFWSMAGAGRIEFLPQEKHDNLMAAISHTPQILSTVLAAVLGYGAASRSELGPGGRDMTRLAGSSWEMWQPLLAATPGKTLAILEAIESELQTVRKAIQSGDFKDLSVTWAIARGWQLEEEEEEEES